MKEKHEEKINNNPVDQTCLDIERAKTILIKQLYQESFYGILGTHPKANTENIKRGFKAKLNEIRNSSRNVTENRQLAIVLKSYATLTSSYKKDYDEYLENYKNGLVEAIELLYENGTPIEDLAKFIQLHSVEMQPWSVFMQPWSTGNKTYLQPWSTSK